MNRSHSRSRQQSICGTKWIPSLCHSHVRSLHSTTKRALCFFSHVFRDELWTGLFALVLVCSHVAYTHPLTVVRNGRKPGNVWAELEVGLPEGPERLGSEALITVRAIFKRSICLRDEHSTMPTPELIRYMKLLSYTFNFPRRLRRSGQIHAIFFSVCLFVCLMGLSFHHTVYEWRSWMFGWSFPVAH